jgi:cadmium resistance protein CadD (predicted permease)
LAAGLGADLGIAAAAFVGTNVDNCFVTMAMVAGAPLERAHRIAAGQVFGFVALVAASVAGAAVLFEFSTAVVGLLGLVPLALGVRGLVGLRRAHPEEEVGTGGAEVAGGAGGRGRGRSRRRTEQRAVGRSFTAAVLVTVAAGGDNLAVYIPLFRVGGATNLAAIAAVFVAGEVVVTWLVLTGGRHPKARAVMLRLGAVAVPVLLCGIGVLVMVQAGTFSLL